MAMSDIFRLRISDCGLRIYRTFQIVDLKKHSDCGMRISDLMSHSEFGFTEPFEFRNADLIQISDFELRIC
jgi:hypothetical protein